MNGENWIRWSTANRKKKASSHFGKLEKIKRKLPGDIQEHEIDVAEDKWEFKDGNCCSPSRLYHVLRGLGNASTIHAKETWLSTGAATNWLTALTDGGTA